LPSCTDITNALEVLASAVPDTNQIADFTSQLAVTYNSEPTVRSGQIVQSTSGGNAILSIPSTIDVDGKTVKLLISGYFIGAGGNISVAQGTDWTTVNGSLGSKSTNGFVFEVDFMWSSQTQNINTSTASNPISGVTNQSSLQFVIIAGFPDQNTTDAIVITHCKMQFV